jgi:RNA polymerase sigma-70 factor, ECF subfamily
MNLQENLTRSQEQDMVVAARSGDLAAFKALYERYWGRVYNLAFYMLGDALVAEDLSQTVFLKVHKGLADFRFESALSTWIYRIALNECQNQQRRRGAELVPLEAILGSGDELDTGPAPDRQHQRSEMKAIIEQVVGELPPRLRAVVVLKYMEELSYDEIAAVLGCAQGTVASRLSRALAELESRLRPLRRML